MKKMLYVIIVVLVVICVVYHCKNRNNNNLAINDISISDRKPSVYIKDNDSTGRSIEFIFFSSSTIHSIDTFMIVVNDGYIYKGIYSDNIVINNLHIKPQNSGYENYTTIGFVGFDNELVAKKAELQYRGDKQSVCDFII